MRLVVNKLMLLATTLELLSKSAWASTFHYRNLKFNFNSLIQNTFLFLKSVVQRISRELRGLVNNSKRLVVLLHVDMLPTKRFLSRVARVNDSMNVLDNMYQLSH